MRVLVIVTIVTIECAAFPLYPFYSSTPADLSVTWNAESIQHEFNRRHEHNVPLYEHRTRLLPLIASSNSDQKRDLIRFGEIVTANGLSNPCQVNGKQSNSSSVVTANRALLGLFKELISKANFVKGFTERIIKLNQIEECSQLELPHIANTPTIGKLNELPSREQRLQSIYKSLLNQTIHSYYIWEKQRNNENDSCDFNGRNKKFSESRGSPASESLGQHYYTIAVNFKDLMCLFTQATQAMNTGFESNKIVNSILDHTIIDVKLCSRRAVRDCQVLKSSLLLLNTLKQYFQRKSEYLNLIS